jgi:hypothetical protein
LSVEVLSLDKGFMAKGNFLLANLNDEGWILIRYSEIK